MVLVGLEEGKAVLQGNLQDWKKRLYESQQQQFPLPFAGLVEALGEGPS